MIDLRPLHPRHGEAILAGQDELLAREIIGRPWDRPGLEAFLDRVAAWRPDGPLREFAALSRTEDGDQDPLVRPRAQLVGGGGLAMLGAGLERGQAALTYWVLEAHRGRGHGHAIAAALLAHARAEPRIRELVLRICPDNHASQAVAHALGARPSGRSEPHPSTPRRLACRWSLMLEPRREDRPVGAEPAHGG